MMFFKAGPCFPSKRIRQFSDGETVHDAIPLSTGISLSGVINELAPKELLENEWNCVLADRSLLLVRQALVGQKDFATVHLISLLDWLLKLQELSPTNHWSSARPMILYLCPDEHRLEKVKYIFARLTVEWEEYDRRSVPVLISTPSKLVTLLSSNQVNVEIIEKIFIENVSAFKDPEAVCKVIDKVHKDVEKIEGIGIHNLSLYLETTTNCPLLQMLIKSYLDPSALFCTDDLIETAAVCQVQLYPIQVQNQTDGKLRINELMKAVLQDGSDENCHILVPDASRENYHGGRTQPMANLVITNRTDSVSNVAKMLVLPVLPKNGTEILKILAQLYLNPIRSPKETHQLFIIVDPTIESPKRLEKFYNFYRTIMKDNDFDTFDHLVKKTINSHTSTEMLCHELRLTGKCQKQFYCQKRHFVKETVLPKSGHAKIKMTAVNGTNQLWAHILEHDEITLNALKIVDKLNIKFNSCINKEKSPYKGWYRARVLRTLPGAIKKDEFGNLQKNIRLIDTGEILQELEKDLQPLGPEFNEVNIPIACCSIQIIGLTPNIEDGSFSKDSRLLLSELIEFNSSVAEIEIIAAIEQTLFVNDIKLNNTVSLVGELERKNLARICPLTKQSFFHYLNVMVEGHEQCEKPVISPVQLEDKANCLLERNDTSNSTNEDEYDLNTCALSKKSDEADSINISDFEVVTADSIDLPSNEIIPDLDVQPLVEDVKPEDEPEIEPETNEIPTFEACSFVDIKSTISLMVGLDTHMKDLIIKLFDLISTNEDFEKVITEANPALTELFGNCKQNEFETDDFDTESSDIQLYSFKHGVFQIISPFLKYLVRHICTGHEAVLKGSAFKEFILVFSSLLWYCSSLCSSQIRLMYVNVIGSLWKIFGNTTFSTTDEEYKIYIFNELLESLSQGFYKLNKYENCTADFVLFRQIVMSESHIWKTLRKPAIKCAEEIILQFSAKKPDDVSVLDEVSTSILNEWIVPLLKYYRTNEFANLGKGTVAFNHIAVIIRHALKEFLFEPVVNVLVNEIQLLKQYDDFVISQMSNVEDPANLKEFIGSTLTKIIREVNKARIIQNYRQKCKAEQIDPARVPAGVPLSNLNLKWSEHRGWLQVKTDMPRGTTPIQYYTAKLSKDGKSCHIYICDMDDHWYGQEIEFTKSICGVQMAPLSDTVIKIRIDKPDRTQWGKITNRRHRNIISDIDAQWSDYDEDDADEVFEYSGVHPDQDQIPELDDFECFGDLEDLSLM